MLKLPRSASKTVFMLVTSLLMKAIAFSMRVFACSSRPSCCFIVFVSLLMMFMTRLSSDESRRSVLTNNSLGRSCCDCRGWKNLFSNSKSIFNSHRRTVWSRWFLCQAIGCVWPLHTATTAITAKATESFISKRFASIESETRTEAISRNAPSKIARVLCDDKNKPLE